MKIDNQKLDIACNVKNLKLFSVIAQNMLEALWTIVWLFIYLTLLAVALCFKAHYSLKVFFLGDALTSIFF